MVQIVPISQGVVIGAGIELFMIKVRVGSETFYDTAKRLEATRRAERMQAKEELERRVLARTRMKQGEN